MLAGAIPRYLRTLGWGVLHQEPHPDVTLASERTHARAPLGRGYERPLGPPRTPMAGIVCVRREPGSEAPLGPLAAPRVHENLGMFHAHYPAP